MSDVSLLPDSFREQEEQLKKEGTVHDAPAASATMHIPAAEQEDVEIIEVDESEVEEMLMTEPLYSRVYYKVGVWIDTVRDKMFKPQLIEPPPKLPPQFFQPPKPKPPTVPSSKFQVPSTEGKQIPTTPAIPGAVQTAVPVKTPGTVEVKAGEEAKLSPAQLQARPKARIIPSGSATARQRRIRIIKRIRKPVQVSLLDQEFVYQMQVNVPGRKFTLAFLSVLFGIVFAGAYFLLDNAKVQAADESQRVQSEYSDIQSQVREQQGKWLAFQDLEGRLIALNTLLDNHVAFSNALAFFERNTLKDVYFGGFNLDNSGKISLSVTAGSIPSAARQLLVFKQAPELASVEATAFSQSADEGCQAIVKYNLAIQFKPEALRLGPVLAAAKLQAAAIGSQPGLEQQQAGIATSTGPVVNAATTSTN